MANITINSLPTASTIDATNDLLPIYTNSLTATQAISRNTYLNLSSQPVGLTDSQTLTNKTLTSPTINGATLSGTLAGTYTIGGTPTFPSSVTQNTVVQTLTNKTLTSPTINSPTITNATISADTLTGYTTSNSGTIYGIAVTSGAFSGSNIIVNSNITDSNVSRTKINWSTFSNNIKSALNTSTPTLTNTDQDLASCGLSLSFTCSGAAYAFVTVALSVGSTSDFEFRPEIRLGGVVQATYSPPAAVGNASSRTYVRTFSYGITLVNGVNTISAGVFLSAATSPFLQVGAGSISAIVLGNVTA